MSRFPAVWLMVSPLLAAPPATGLELVPVPDVPWFELRAPGLSSEPLIVRLPEHIVTLEGLVPQGVVWEQANEGCWRFRWEADRSVKTAKQTDFRAEVTTAADEVAFTFHITNPTDSAWTSERYNAFDVICGRIPGLRDPEGTRTFVYVNDRFVSVKEALGDQLQPGQASWMVLRGSHQAPDFRQYTHRLMARTSEDGQWVVAIASDTGDGATFNLDPDTSCIHQNRTWKPLQAGESRVLQGKVYVLQGGLADLWERYLADERTWARDRDAAQVQGQQSAKQEQETVVGYLPTVWAPPTPSPTLQRLARMRPVSLPEHPLAAWVADRLARDTGQRAERSAIAGELAAFRKTGKTWVRQDGSGLWISNGEVGVALLPPAEGLAIASLYHLPTRTECIFTPPTSGPPWRLQRFEGAGLVDDAPTQGAPEVQVICRRGGATVHMVWRGPVAVHATLTLPPAGSLLRWRAQLIPREGQALPYALHFPVIHGLGAPGENDITTSWGSGRGQLFRGARARLWNSDCRYPDSNWTTQMLSMSFGPSVLYLACHDGAYQTKSFALDPGGEFRFTNYVPQNGSGKPLVYETPEMVIGPLEGDWFTAAQTYREWALRQQWCAAGPLRQRVRRGQMARALLEAPFVAKPNWTFGDGDDWSKHLLATEIYGLRHLDADRELVGRDLPVSVWWYGWENERFDDDTPIFTPREGVAQAFRRQVEEGLTVMPYTQSLLWDTKTPRFDAEAQAAICKSRDGLPQITRWHWCEAASMCLSQRVCQETSIGLARTVAEAGANAIYLDAFPVMRECWDTAHGHPLGVGGNWWADSVRSILRGIKAQQGSQFGIMQEYYSEPYLDLVDLQMSWWYVEETDCPLLPAIYSQYAVWSGSHTHKHYPDDIVSFRIKQGRCLLWGSQLGRAQFSDYLYDEAKATFLRQAVRLRYRLTDVLTYGRMLRPPPWECPVPRVTAEKWNMGHLGTRRLEYDAVESALWRADDGSAVLLLANYDDAPHNVRFRVSPWWRGAQARASLLGGDQERTWRATVRAGDLLDLELPDAAVCALRFVPAD